jgi:hypothetical protein
MKKWQVWTALLLVQFMIVDVILVNMAAHSLWTTLDHLNQSLAAALLSLSAIYSKDPKVYVNAVDYISTLQPLQVSLHPLISNDVRFSRSGLQARRYLRMKDLSLKRFVGHTLSLRLVAVGQIFFCSQAYRSLFERKCVKWVMQHLYPSNRLNRQTCLTFVSHKQV